MDHVMRYDLLLKGLFCYFLLFPLSAFSEEPIKLGAIFSLSGFGAEGGTADLNGALLAQEEINSGGGINGRKLEIIIEDNQSDLRSTASAFRKLVDIDQVLAIVGPNWAEFTEVLAPLAEASKVAFISPSGYKEGLFTDRDFAFTLWPPHTLATKPLSELLKSRDYKSIAVFLSENAYFEGIFEALEEQISDSIEVHPPMRFNEGELDFRSSISRTRRAAPDAVLVLLTENAGLSTFFTQANQLNLNLPLYSSNGVVFDHIIMNQLSIINDVVYYDFFVPGDDTFKERYRERFNLEPGFASAKAYDAVFLIKKAVEGCAASRAGIQECLSSVEYRGQSGAITFDSDGVIESDGVNTYLLQVKDGQIQTLD